MNRREIERGIVLKRWGDRMILVGEGVGLLDLIKQVNKRTKDVENGKLITCSDNKHFIKKLHSKARKSSNCTREAGRIIEEIRREASTIKHDMCLEYSNDRLDSSKRFDQQHGAELIKRCNSVSKENKRALENEIYKERTCFRVIIPR